MNKNKKWSDCTQEFWEDLISVYNSKGSDSTYGSHYALCFSNDYQFPITKGYPGVLILTKEAVMRSGIHWKVLIANSEADILRHITNDNCELYGWIHGGPKKKQVHFITR